MSVNPHVLQYLDGKLAATGSQALPYDEWSKPALRDQLLQLVERYPSLSVRDDPFTHNDGRTTRLLRAEGTVPIYYQGVKYNIPVQMFLPEGFPRVGPICYVTPTANMIIKPGHGLVDGGGLVRRDPSGDWRYPASALAEFARSLADAFGREPPLFAKPPGYEAHPSPPAPQGRTDAYAPRAGEYRREGAAANGDARGAPAPYRGRGQPPPPPPPAGTALSSSESSRPGASRYPSPPRSPRGQYPPQPGAHGHAGARGGMSSAHGAGGPQGAYLPPPPPPPAAARGAAARGAYSGDAYPQPPPGVSTSQSASLARGRPNSRGGPADVDTTGCSRSLAEATFKSRASKALTARLKRELAVLQTTAAAEAERLLGVQAELARRRETLEAGLREMRAERARWEGRVGSLRAATVQSEEWLAERAKRAGDAGAAAEGETKTAPKASVERCDAAFAEEDGVSRQLLRAVAKDAALEDTMDALDEGLDKGVLKLPDWLRATRKLSKEQFMARAETLVVRKHQTQRGVSGGVAFRSA